MLRTPSPSLQMDDVHVRAQLEELLRTLAAAARRKLPMVKDTAERAIMSLRTGAGADAGGAEALADELLQPLILTCNHKNATPKLVGMALDGLQKLASHMPLSAVQLRNVVRVLAIQASAVNQKTKLRILQTLPLLAASVTEGGSAFFHADADSVVQALTICFFMQSTKGDHIIASTAHFTLRQLTTMLFDTIATRYPRIGTVAPGESGGARAEAEAELRAVEDLPRGRSGGGGEGGADEPSQRMGLLIFSDLCSFAEGQVGEWLTVVEPTRELAFELLQSIVTTHARIFARLGAFSELLRQKLFPLLITTLRAPSPMSAHVVVSVSKLLSTSVATFVRCFTL